MTSERFSAYEIVSLLRDGPLDRAMGVTPWQIPKRIGVEGDQLIWDYSETVSWATPGRDMLVDFTTLRDGDPEGILPFARKYGVLVVCKHGELASHTVAGDQVSESESDPSTEPTTAEPTTDNDQLGEPSGPVNHPSDATGYFARCELRRTESGAYREPLSLWKTLAGEMHALIRLAAAVRRGEPGLDEDWDRLSPYLSCVVADPPGGFGFTLPVMEEETTDAAASWTPPQANRRFVLARAVNWWLRMGLVRPEFFWADEAPQVVFGSGGSLVGALAIQAMLILGSREGLAFCDGCETVYSPPRNPRKGKRKFCERCRKKGIPQRMAKQDERRRKRENQK